MKPKRMMATRTRPVGFKDGKWSYETEVFEMRVLAEAEGYSMVRRKGAMAFVISTKDLSPLTPGATP